MSIAVCAVVVPSRRLRMALFGYAAASGAVAAALLLSPERFHFAGALAAFCLLAAAVAGRAGARPATTRQIDISGLGQLRLTVQQSMGEAAPYALVTLMPGSTVWSHALLLLLRNADNGAVTVLTILPDSVAHDQFRKLAVGIRAIARRDKEFSEKHKIH
jgi:toxin CptA